MAARFRRDDETYEQFLLHLREAGLEEGIRDICRKHGVVPREIYLDFRGTSTVSARLEVWWWLSTTWKKSHLEIGRIFHRETTSVTHAFAKLHQTAREMNKELQSPEDVHDAARKWATDVSTSRHLSGKAVAQRRHGSQKEVCHPGVTEPPDLEKSRS